ncbi:MAG: hypothetical protein ACQ9MH_08175 [Nitrospinales bacterium]
MRFGKASVVTGFFLSFMLIMSMPVLGSTGHVHKNISPFEKNGQKINMHCLLNKHNHQNQICPHALLLVQNNKDGIFLSTECGGNPHGSIPVKNIFHNNPGMTNSFIFLPPFNSVEAMFSKSFPNLFHLPISLDRPPKNV